MSRVLVISYSDLARDSRLDRQIGFLRRRHEVIAAGLGAPAYDDVGFIDLRMEAGRISESRRRAALLTRRYGAAYWASDANRHAVRRLTGHGADLVVANEVAALPLAVRVAAGARLMFDAHEMATSEWAHLRWWRLLWAPYVDWLLRTYLPRVDAMTTVSTAIAGMYRDRYGIRPSVVTNACVPAMLEPTPVHSPIRMISHGVADPQRQLELMIDATDQLKGRFTLDLMLVPTDRTYLERLRAASSATPWVRILDPLPQREITSHCNDYDVGVYLLPPLNENALYALPNKFFEFVQARLAVVIGPSPEMAALVTSLELGVVAEEFTATALVQALDGLTPELVAAYKQHADEAAGHLNSERNAEIMLELVDRLLSERGA